MMRLQEETPLSTINKAGKTSESFRNFMFFKMLNNNVLQNIWQLYCRLCTPPSAIISGLIGMKQHLGGTVRKFGQRENVP